MDQKKLEKVVLQLESYVECWRQLSHYLNQARLKKFDQDDESQFLEFKCVVTQELEGIFAAMECSIPTKDEIHKLLINCPSIRYLSELNETSLRGLENQWHKIYIAWHSNLGQLKAARHVQQNASRWWWFRR